ncbi:hypothetical protein F383_10782 [Gossypium arboreum]|uniref:Uncharacterized protein n=1 Tax=Gossypium arboreum TaxID=29729 RepID=A0A0B0PZ73_GOSAR|nr:hypothetical protein F383_10782 [Gossypium arboreum]
MKNNSIKPQSYHKEFINYIISIKSSISCISVPIRNKLIYK